MKYLQILAISALLTFSSLTVKGNLFRNFGSQFEKIYKSKQGLTEDKGSNQFTVHIIPHTHDDVGWIKTVDEFYSGSRQRDYKAGVRVVIDGMIQELLRDSKKRFSYVEMKFFSLWFYEQTHEMQDKVRKLVKDGQLEFLNGGWSMHDEACPHFEDMIENMMYGHKFLDQEFGFKPKIGWSIDPFGHSNTNARFFAEMGFDAWFFARLDYQDKDRRQNDTELEFVWRPSFDYLGKSAQIFSHTLFQHYSAPSGFNFDMYGSADPIEDNPELETYNMESRIDQFYQYVMNQRKYYKSQKNMILLFGDDFNYYNARMYFLQLDKLIYNFNKRYPNITLTYSTPSAYINAIKQENIEWTTKYDDGFPYGDDQWSYWTGYYTSRANSKDQIRRGSHVMHSSGKLYALESLIHDRDNLLQGNMSQAQNFFLDAMGVNQHHDAVTGTSRQRVADNYAWKIYKAMAKNNPVVERIIEKIANGIDSQLKSQQWKVCLLENSTYLDCPINDHINESISMAVIVFNPSTKPQNYIQIAVPHAHWEVKAFNTLKQKYEIANSSVICEDETQWNGHIMHNCQLFIESTVDAQQMGLIWLKNNFQINLQVKRQNVINGQSQISNNIESLTFLTEDSNHGQKFEINKLEYNQKYEFAFDFRYYLSSQDDISRSGAYLFRPDANFTSSFRYSKLANISLYKSDIVQQMTFVYWDDKTNQSAVGKARYLRNDPLMHWDVKINEIPLGEQGIEVTVNFWSNMDNNNTFYTDSNGLEMQKRILGYRPTWNLTDQTDNTSCNYYPIQTAIAIRDEEGNQMTIMNDKSQGGSVLEPGRIEIMQSRRTLFDDSRGMGEPLNETDQYGRGISVFNRYQVQLFNRREEKSLQRLHQVHQDDPLQYFFNFDHSLETRLDVSDIQHIRLPNSTELQSLGLPETGKIVMLYKDHMRVIIRIENIADNFDLLDAVQNVTYFNLEQYAHLLYKLANQGQDIGKKEFVNIHEVTLTLNQPQDQMIKNKFVWKTVDDSIINDKKLALDKGNQAIALEPQRIRSFIISYGPKNM
ncbi:glycosyl hydrolases family 38 protein [Stylonychia lemnae]|uniref:Glycosyl hydrolases family 38 protein n=1 Tax=Stylonychia lemnae TaxID=5949 RepID=A0A078ABP9_STYLE|nr:glycosyl hydrolases family 38 protein [Stylonychia lemnae]|eukprot:CDW79296.1 glycosyl hydrolases family 38 protein [Stylonychia lemnae]